jgi:hypothetical protein
VKVHHDDEARKTKNGEMRPYLARQMSIGFTTLPPVPLLEQYRCGSFIGGAQIAVELAIREHSGHQDLRGSGRRSVIPYVHG